MKKKGKVFLVGAGPGDPGLITLKGKEALEQAEVVIYDWLANPELLKWAPCAEKIFVGKKGGTQYKKQEEINNLLLAYARKGKNIVRLKGGDPFVFGRGGEEASFLGRHKISFEVIPGISAGTGVPTYAGIPLTDRRFASQVTFVTGHEDLKKAEPLVDWKHLALFKGTIVSFMGVKNLSQIVKALVEGGKSAATPVALVEWGTLPCQRIVTGTLKDIMEKAQKAKLDSPTLAIIGEVVKLREKLAWFEKRPLSGKTVLVTRARAQASDLVRKLTDQGAQIVEYPTIEIFPPASWRPLERAVKKLSQFDWVIFTSTNGVQFFFERLSHLKKDTRIFAGIKVAAIGKFTALALRERGIEADLTPKEFTSLALFEALKKAGEIRGKRFLLARADIAPAGLKNSLEKEGGRVIEIETYRTRKPLLGAAKLPAPKGTGRVPIRDLLRQGKIDYITFTSSSTVRNFFESIPSHLRRKIFVGTRHAASPLLISIGPVTSQTLREYGFKPNGEAKVHTIDGLVEVLTKKASRPTGRKSGGGNGK